MSACHRLRHFGSVLALACFAAVAGCQTGVVAPVPFQITLEDEKFDVRRYRFLSRGGFVELAPVAVRRSSWAGFGPGEQALAERVLEEYCARFGFDLAPRAATYWTKGGTWHFAQGCTRPV